MQRARVARRALEYGAAQALGGGGISTLEGPQGLLKRALLCGGHGKKNGHP